MSMRETHASEKKGVTGSTRSHIISRLHKATIYAKNLCGLLNDQASSGATLNDILEARAYAASLTGSMAFEKQSWDACVRSYSEARIIYCVLAVSIKSDIFKGLLEDPIDQSIRYGAYQLSIPRTVAVPSIAKKFFPRSESDLVSWVERLDPDALSEQPTRAQTTTTGSGAIPKSINWRSRTVELEDATIATALASVNSATSKLSDALASVTTTWPKEQATAYDDILIASQDAVDATKHAIDELVAEGVGQGDKRIQSLQITRTAASYEMVSWRIGRNRVLVGEHDGAMAEISVLDPSRNKGASLVKQEGIGRKLTLLREKSVLYDSILQSLDSIMELPGVAADSKFVEELDAKYAYFSALK
jgi:signal recognition particle subunit SRP68